MRERIEEWGTHSGIAEPAGLLAEDILQGEHEHAYDSPTLLLPASLPHTIWMAQIPQSCRDFRDTHLQGCIATSIGVSRQRPIPVKHAETTDHAEVAWITPIRAAARDL